jgi:hypothetical protein
MSHYSQEFEPFETQREQLASETNTGVLNPFSFEQYKKSEEERIALLNAKKQWKQAHKSPFFKESI